jgi:phosphoenolpyruvate synthase/pyruvate phosphate dikinase
MKFFPSQDEGSTHNDAGSIVWLENELGSKVVQGAVEQSAPDSFELSAETLAKIDEELAEIVTRPW